MQTTAEIAAAISESNKSDEVISDDIKRSHSEQTNSVREKYARHLTKLKAGANASINEDDEENESSGHESNQDEEVSFF